MLMKDWVEIGQIKSKDMAIKTLYDIMILIGKSKRYGTDEACSMYF